MVSLCKLAGVMLSELPAQAAVSTAAPLSGAATAMVLRAIGPAARPE